MALQQSTLRYREVKQIIQGYNTSKGDTRALLQHYVVSCVYHTGHYFSSLMYKVHKSSLKFAPTGTSQTVENHTARSSGTAMEHRMAVWSSCLNTARLRRGLACFFLQALTGVFSLQTNLHQAYKIMLLTAESTGAQYITAFS